MDFLLDMDFSVATVQVTATTDHIFLCNVILSVQFSKIQNKQKKKISGSKGRTSVTMMRVLAKIKSMLINNGNKKK